MQQCNIYILFHCLILFLLIQTIKNNNSINSDKITPLKTISHDIYHTQIFLDRKSIRMVNFENKLDFKSISSNFSTNTKGLIPPGVVGRYKPINIIFPDKNFHPQKMVSSKGSFMILSKNRKHDIFIQRIHELFLKIESHVTQVLVLNECYYIMRFFSESYNDLQLFKKNI